MGRRIPNGYLIAFDGIDGAGKTTQSKLLADRLQALGLDVAWTREPTAGKWGQLVRESALTGRLSAEEELNAFMDDRREHVETFIRPALEQGQVVVLDRYFLSTVAYQGALGIDVSQLLGINEAFAPIPDAYFVLEVPARIGLERVAGRGDRANHFEQEANLERCARIFAAIDRPYVRRLNATAPIGELADLIMWGLWEGGLAARSTEGEVRLPGAPAAQDALAVARRIADDASIPIGEKPEALLRALRAPTA